MDARFSASQKRQATKQISDLDGHVQRWWTDDIELAGNVVDNAGDAVNRHPVRIGAHSGNHFGGTDDIEIEVDQHFRGAMR